MNKKSTPLVDEHLQSIIGIQEAQTDNFFYTRLRARMEENTPGQEWKLPLKPAWIVGGLTLLLTVNGFMLAHQQAKKNSDPVVSSSLQSFAEAYDQTIVSSY
jgi:hypothetical protein